MTPDEAIREADSRALRPVYLIAGDETYLHGTVLAALRGAALEGAVPGLNEDQLVADERTVDDALGAARTLPMMAKRRLVVVQRLERWEPRSNNDAEPSETSSKKHAKDPFERLLDYAKQPSPSTTLILLGVGLDKRRKLVVTARNEGWLFNCEPMGRADLPIFVER
jgi:DNA polymerase-3 subunit delta